MKIENFEIGQPLSQSKNNGMIQVQTELVSVQAYNPPNFFWLGLLGLIAYSLNDDDKKRNRQREIHYCECLCEN